MEILITGFNFIKDNFFWVLMILGVLVWIFPETFLSKIFPKKENPNKAPMDYVAKDSATGKKRILKLAITLYGLVIANRNNKLDFELLGVKNPSVLSFLEAFKNVEEENVRVSSIRFIQNLSNKQLDILSQEFSIVNKTFNGLHIDPRVQMYTFSELMNSMEKFKIFHKSSDDSSMFDDGLFHDLSIYKYNPHDVEKFNDFKVSNSLDLFDHPINGLGSLNGSDLMNHHDSHRGFDSFNDQQSQLEVALVQRRACTFLGVNRLKYLRSNRNFWFFISVNVLYNNHCVVFNPKFEADPTWQEFVAKKDECTLHINIGWRDNPWFPESLSNQHFA